MEETGRPAARRWLACLAAAMAASLLAACAGPVPDEGAYRHAALTTATAMISNLAAAELSAQVALRGGNLAAFTDDSVTNAEDDANSVSSTFESRQPPDSRAGALGQKMSQALSQAASALTSLRVAVRRNSGPEITAALADVGKALRLFHRLEQELR